MMQFNIKSTLIAIATVASGVVFADGFICQSTDDVLRVKVFNHTQASVGTRTGAVMIISDQTVSYGRQTIAVFSNDENNLLSSGSNYFGYVQTQAAGTARSGEYIGGTRLGELSRIALAVDYNYAQPTVDGAELRGRLSLYKEAISPFAVIEMVCERYLKN